MAKFIQIKFENPKMKQSETTDHLRYSSSTLKTYRNHINMLSRYRIQPKITNRRKKKVLITNFDNNSRRENDLKVSKYLNWPEINLTQTFVKPDMNKKSNKRKKTLKGGSMHENVEFNEENLDEIVHNKKT